MPAQSPDALTTLSVALLFAAIFLFGGRAAYRPGQRGRRRFLSFAAGVSVAYTFVHVLPALHAIRELQTESPGTFKMLFPGVRRLPVDHGRLPDLLRPRNHGGQSATRPGEPAGDDGGAAPWQPWVHMGGFALYTWILTYMMVWTGKGTLALCLFAVAMGMHIFTITCGLSSHYQEVYDRRGAFLLALASLAGWASALTLNIPSSNRVEPGGLRGRRRGRQCGDRRAPKGEGGPVLVLPDGRAALYGPAADPVPLRERRRAMTRK